jgi:hypothetical protein
LLSGRGFYELTVTATPTAGNKEVLAGNSGAVLLVKALAQISVDAVELGVADSDQVDIIMKPYMMQFTFY